jgi:hypothetical protein
MWSICALSPDSQQTGAAKRHGMKTDLKNLLSALVSADYPTFRLAALARREIETAWGGLSTAEIAELDVWLRDQEMTTQRQARVSWVYVRAALTSVQQTQGAL